MAWRHPKRIPRSGRVVDPEDLNDAVQPFVEEDGRLNEQNWSEALATQLTRADLEDDVSFRVLHKSNFIDASDLDGGSPQKFSANQTWQPILMDGTNSSFAFASRGGKLAIAASLQISMPGDPGEWGDGTAVANQRRSFLMYSRFGVLINGALEPISVVGDQDSLSEGESMETGVSGYCNGVDLFITVPVSPGRHDVAIVVAVDNLLEGSDEALVLVYSTELLVWEMR